MFSLSAASALPSLDPQRPAQRVGKGRGNTRRYWTQSFNCFFLKRLRVKKEREKDAFGTLWDTEKEVERMSSGAQLTVVQSTVGRALITADIFEGPLKGQFNIPEGKE